jgi:hypothetical protein
MSTVETRNAALARYLAALHALDDACEPLVQLTHDAGYTSLGRDVSLIRAKISGSVTRAETFMVALNQLKQRTA